MTWNDKDEAIAIAKAGFRSVPMLFRGASIDETWPTEALLGLIQMLMEREDDYRKRLAKRCD